MATRIFEMKSLAIAGNPYPVRRTPWLARQSMTATASSAQSAAFNAETRIVSVQSDEAVVVEFGEDPTADADSFKIDAGGEADFWVEAGHKMALKTA